MPERAVVVMHPTHTNTTTLSQIPSNSQWEFRCGKDADSFQSLVNFVKEGNNLTDQGTSHACRLLRENTPSSEQAANQILFSLVPSPDNSCSGFTESMSLLLTSSNSELVKTAWCILSTEKPSLNKTRFFSD
ncbi:hypothetical protein BLNAU_16934 [Blattamonas nauphoetae]|uniref:Uncharacterized protein n=1 Tax=Blattamonas nauphoetae TaxID=2049346 RepID=A0ABQ9X9Q0_9EUKA|nr:hypothetical protein BLNAU_16934 [Blattamonas nauphoetae]